MVDEDTDQLNIQLLAQMPEALDFRQKVATELKAMAAAQPPYTRFTYMSPRIKAIWRAAAALLETPKPPPRFLDSRYSFVP